MVKIFFFLIIISLNGFCSESSQDKDEALTIFNNLANGEISHKQFFRELNACAQRGNTFCLDGLCLYYYNKENYKIAFSVCTSYTTKLENGVIEGMIGYMLSEGLGVLQNNEKAAEYYIKSASMGNGTSAYNLSRIYNKKMLALHHSKNYSEEFEQYLIFTYAWTKIAKALGKEKIEKNNGGEVEISELIEMYREWLMSLSILEKGDALAKELCSHISNCVQ